MQFLLPNDFLVGVNACCKWLNESIAEGKRGCYTVSMDRAILEREAMRLPAHQRALLADALLLSLDDETARQVESAWAQEAEARLAAYHRGEVAALDGPTVLRELRNRYAK